MTATVTALIGLAVDHGIGVAFLVVGAQVLLDRLMPVEFVVSHLFGSKKSVHTGGTHRAAPAPHSSLGRRFASSLERDRNEPIGCTK